MKSIVLCGSQRFKDEIKQFADKLRKLGASLVYEPEFKEREYQFMNLPENERLTTNAHYRTMVPGLVFHHMQRLREAEIVYIYNPDGYMGINTTLEMGAAHILNKPIFTFSKEKPYAEGGEMCREILVNDIIKTPEELIKKLQ